MPTVIGKYKKQATISQLKKAYTVLSQMVIKSLEYNGAIYFSTSDEVDPDVVKTFFDKYWLPYFNNPTVSKAGIYPYGTNMAFKFLNGNNASNNVLTDYAWGRMYLTVMDGTAFYVEMMKWDDQVYDEDGNLISRTAKYSAQQNVYVDLNGIKPPNTLGKDVFIFQVFFDKSIVRPYGYDKSQAEINQNCSLNNTGEYCAAKIINEGWTMRDDYPW